MDIWIDLFRELTPRSEHKDYIKAFVVLIVRESLHVDFILPDNIIKQQYKQQQPRQQQQTTDGVASLSTNSG